MFNVLGYMEVPVINWKMAIYYLKLVFTVYILLLNIIQYCTLI